MSSRYILVFSLLVLLGPAGCRSRRNTAEAQPSRSSTACRRTGPLNRSQAAEEALAAVSAQAEEGSSCTVASVKEGAGAYEVCVRVDSPPTGERKLPKHWTVEVPKSGITRGLCAGAG